MYRRAFEPLPRESDGRPESHWLWESEPLLRRLGDLGPDAMFVAVDPRASLPNVNGAGIEAMCRIGPPGRALAEPVLLERWRKNARSDANQRRALFVAMRRIGVPIPPLIESAEDRARRERRNATFGRATVQQESPMAELVKKWVDVTSASPPRVCSPSEEQARREEKFGGKRRTNMI